MGVFKSQFYRDFFNFWRQIPTKWLQERHNGSKNDAVMPPRRASRGVYIDWYFTALSACCLRSRDWHSIVEQPAPAPHAPKEELPHKRPFVGVSGCRSWSRSIAFEGNYRQKMTNLLAIDFSNTPTKGLTWLTHQLHTQSAHQLRVYV